MLKCNQCSYYEKKGKACEFAHYADLILEEKSDMETPCHDEAYLEYLLTKAEKAS